MIGAASCYQNYNWLCGEKLINTSPNHTVRSTSKNRSVPSQKPKEADNLARPWPLVHLKFPPGGGSRYALSGDEVAGAVSVI